MQNSIQPTISQPPLNEAEQRWLSAWLEGPRRTRWDVLPPQIGDLAPDIALVDSDGVQVRLSDFWARTPVVLVFLRHYGCSCTAGRIARLAEEVPQLEAAHAHVVCIGQGEPSRAQQFKLERDLPATLLCDPERRAYEAYGLLEGLPSQIVYDAPEEFLRRDAEAGTKLQLSRKGTPRVPVDSPWQMPGDVVIGRGGHISLMHRPAYCDDYIDNRVLLAALRESELKT